MELFLVCGWSDEVAFGSEIGKLVGAELKLWDSDPIWGPLPGPGGDTWARIPQVNVLWKRTTENVVGFHLGVRAPLGEQEPLKHGRL